MHLARPDLPLTPVAATPRPCPLGSRVQDAIWLLFLGRTGAGAMEPTALVASVRHLEPAFYPCLEVVCGCLEEMVSGGLLRHDAGGWIDRTDAGRDALVALMTAPLAGLRTASGRVAVALRLEFLNQLDPTERPFVLRALRDAAARDLERLGRTLEESGPAAVWQAHEVAQLRADAALFAGLEA